jgi:hypothetical protein
MISIEDVPGMIEDFELGNLDFREVYSLCLDLFERHEVEEVLVLLPAKLRGDLASALRTVYDNDVLPGNFLLLDSARGDHPAKAVIIDRIRSWLARHPFEASGRDAGH